MTTALLLYKCIHKRSETARVSHVSGVVWREMAVDASPSVSLAAPCEIFCRVSLCKLGNGGKIVDSFLLCRPAVCTRTLPSHVIERQSCDVTCLFT